MTDALTALLAAGHRLGRLEIQGRWVDVRDPEVLAAVEQAEANATQRHRMHFVSWVFFLNGLLSYS